MCTKKPEVGQTLYSLNIGNAARNREQILTPVTVVKVGRKYFTCSKEGSRLETQYRIDGWIENTEYTANSCLYESVQEWEDEKEHNSIYQKIKNKYFSTFGSKKISLDSLRKINEILEDDHD